MIRVYQAPPRAAWRTADELAFLENLGTHAEHDYDRAYLLRRYLEGVTHRAEWGDVDRLTVVSTAQRMAAQA